MSGLQLYYYRIGGHCFAIDTCAGIDPTHYVPSLLPFAMEATTGEPCFTLSLKREIESSTILHEIIDFEWEGARFQISATDGGYEFTVYPEGNEMPGRKMLVNSGFTRATAEFDPADSYSPFVTNNFLMILYAFATAPHATLMFHASVIMKDGYAYLFLGRSGTGKSTHSRLWLTHIPEAELLNDDNPIVRLHSDGTVKVYGSPWSGKTPCYRNEEATVGAFVRIKQAPENRIERKGLAHAFASLLPSCSSMKQDKCLYDHICNTISSIVTLVPVYELQCLPDEAAAQLCYSTVSPKR